MIDFRILLICGAILNYPDSIESLVTCRICQQGYECCTDGETLLSVEKIPEQKRSQSLRISDWNIISIAPNAFKDLPIIKLELELSKKNLDLSKESFNGLPTLRVLEINSGVILLKENLFEAMRILSDLKIVILLKEISLKIALLGLNNLRHLNIQNSDLKYIDFITFFKMPGSIFCLELTNNNIEIIEGDTFSWLRELKSLSIARNNMAELQSGVFNGLDKLYTLILSSNKLTSISANIFKPLKNLKFLDLNDNRIGIIEDRAFLGLDIPWLNLEDNQLTVIGNQTFQGTFISALNIGNNKITKIENGAFVGCHLQRLYIYNNSITSINRINVGISKIIPIHLVRNYQYQKILQENHY